MHKFQTVLSSHRKPRAKHCPVLFSGHADGAFLHMHFLHLRQEFFIGKHLHSLLTHVAQPFMPQFSDSVGYHINLIPAQSCMHHDIRFNLMSKTWCRSFSTILQHVGVSKCTSRFRQSCTHRRFPSSHICGHRPCMMRSILCWGLGETTHRNQPLMSILRRLGLLHFAH